MYVSVVNVYTSAVQCLVSDIIVNIQAVSYRTFHQNIGQYRTTFENIRFIDLQHGGSGGMTVVVVVVVVG